MTGPSPEDAVTDALGAILSRRITLALSVLRNCNPNDPKLQLIVDILTGDIDQ